MNFNFHLVIITSLSLLNLIRFFLFFYFHLLYSRFLLVNLSSIVIFNFLSLACILSFSNSIFCFSNSCFLSLVFYSVLLFVLVLHFPTFSLWNFSFDSPFNTIIVFFPSLAVCSYSSISFEFSLYFFSTSSNFFRLLKNYLFVSMSLTELILLFSSSYNCFIRRCHDVSSFVNICCFF